MYVHFRWSKITLRTLLIRCIPPMTVVLLLACLAGCAFTNGSIPPGRSAVGGRVINAEDPTKAIPNALVTIVTTPPGGTTQTFETNTDPAGNFLISGIPTGTQSNAVTLSVDPNDPNFQKQKVSFVLTRDRPTNVIIGLPLSGFDLSQIAAINLVPQTAPSGASQYQVVVLDANGKPLNILPTLIFDGAVASLGANDTFTVAVPPSVPTGNITATVDTHTTNPPATTTPISKGSGSQVGSTGGNTFLGKGTSVQTSYIP